jgi:uncharacterized protein
LNNISFTVLAYLGSMLGGFLGSLTGLGGGVVIVPMLTIFFGVDIRFAAGASLIAVIATSSGSAAAYVKEGYSNIRIGMFLEIATTIGAVIGASLVAIISPNLIYVIFGLVLIYSAVLTLISRKKDNEEPVKDKIATYLKLNGSYPKSGGWKGYFTQKVPFGFGVCTIAGVLSGLLGIGGGAVKVIAMDKVMKIPFKVSTTTSNFMIGVTAAASAGIYFANGFINSSLVMPVLLGVSTGAFVGARILSRTSSQWLKILFSVIIIVLAIEMLRNGLK